MNQTKPLNILLVTPNAPWPPHTGSSQRSALLYDALSELGTVRMICLHNPDHLEQQTREVLENDYGMVAVARRWGDVSREPWNTLARINYAMAARLGNFLGAAKYRYAPDKRLMQSLDIPAILKDVDVVVGRYTTALTCLDLIDGPIPSLIDVDDLDSAAFASQMNAINSSAFDRWTAKRQYKNVLARQPGILKKASGLWIANPDDQKQSGLEDAEYLPNIPFYEAEPGQLDAAPEYTTPVVGVIASYKHHPNVEAVDWFLDNVWGSVLLQQPDAVLKIYGSQIDEPLRQRWSDRSAVEVVGFVDKVSTAYAEMSFSICPVQRGAGTNIKVLESAQFKRLCVLTTSASRGFTAQAEMRDALVVCDDASQMIERVSYYLANPEATRLAAQKLHDAVEQHYSRKAFNQTVHALVKKVLGPAKT